MLPRALSVAIHLASLLTRSLRNLYRLLSDVPGDLSTFSLATLTSASLQSASSTISSLEALFAHWAASVPVQLQSSTSTVYREETTVLTLRSHTVRLLIHRPLLSEAIRASHHEALPAPGDPEYVGALVLKQQAHTMVGQSLSTTLAAGVESIRLLSQTQLTDTLSAGWYRLFYGEHLSVIPVRESD